VVLLLKSVPGVAGGLPGSHVDAAGAGRPDEAACPVDNDDPPDDGSRVIWSG